MAMANNADILRYIDSIARDKEIDKESLIVAIEQAMLQALAKKYGVDDVEVRLDRETGNFDPLFAFQCGSQGSFEPLAFGGPVQTDSGCFRHFNAPCSACAAHPCSTYARSSRLLPRVS